ncbi:MAG: alpha/beta hydrolase [Syntrophaceae bacterium]|nr:alpha/beta hydrolase [Syntrophaceae bacterium]
MSADMTDPIRHPEVEFSVRMVPVEGDVSLRVLQFRPRRDTPLDPLVFVPGFASAIYGWIDFLREIVPLRPVYYIESREKTSARIGRKRLLPADFSIARMAQDLVEACRSLGLDDCPTIVAGSSLGATALIEALKHGRLRAKAGFMIGPNTDFKAPIFIKGLLLLPAGTYHLVKHLVLWYLKNFRIDAAREPEQLQRYRDTLLTADPRRLKRTAQSAIGYTIWQDLQTVTIPIAVTLASTDKLHAEENIRRLTAELPGSKIIPCESNLYMHSAALAGDFERFVSSVK